MGVNILNKIFTRKSGKSSYWINLNKNFGYRKVYDRRTFIFLSNFSLQMNTILILTVIPTIILVWQPLYWDFYWFSDE